MREGEGGREEGRERLTATRQDTSLLAWSITCIKCTYTCIHVQHHALCNNYIYIHVHVYTCTYVYTYVRTYIRTCNSIHVSTYMHVYTKFIDTVPVVEIEGQRQ